MALNKEQAADFVRTINRMQEITDAARGRPDLWLELRDEHLELVSHLDQLSSYIERL